METMVDSKKFKLVKEKCGFTKGMYLSSMGLSGVLDFWWMDLNVDVLTYSANHMAAEIRDVNDVIILMQWVYGWSETCNKHLT